MAEIEQRLLKLRQTMETSQNAKAQAEGALISQRARLTDEFDLKDEDAAEERIEELQETVEELEGELETVIGQLETAYE